VRFRAALRRKFQVERERYKYDDFDGVYEPAARTSVTISIKVISSIP